MHKVRIVGSMVFVIAASLIAPSSCLLLDNVDHLSDGFGSSSDASPVDSQMDGSSPDGTVEASDDPCPGTAGPKPVRVTTPAASFCIDSTEVTRQHYQQFLVAKGGDTSGQSPECGWNDDYVPQVSWPIPTGTENLPVVGVDWCDAVAYCTWAGKRLCGRIGGGSLPIANALDAVQGQWRSACSMAGAQSFPYGNDYDPNACNGGKAATPTGVAVPASYPKCVGATAGVFDLSGNVEEWIDACDTQLREGGIGDKCAIAGGSWQDQADGLACFVRLSIDERDFAYYQRGFRCCGP